MLKFNCEINKLFIEIADADEGDVNSKGGIFYPIHKQGWGDLHMGYWL